MYLFFSGQDPLLLEKANLILPFCTVSRAFIPLSPAVKQHRELLKGNRNAAAAHMETSLSKKKGPPRLQLCWAGETECTRFFWQMKMIKRLARSLSSSKKLLHPAIATWISTSHCVYVLNTIGLLCSVGRNIFTTYLMWLNTINYPVCHRDDEMYGV
jgi:hypothetical protein